jgi:hypothetical protein
MVAGLFFCAESKPFAAAGVAPPVIALAKLAL